METKADLRVQIKVLEARLAVLRLAGYREPKRKLRAKTEGCSAQAGATEVIAVRPNAVDAPANPVGIALAALRMIRMTAEERSEVARLGGLASGKVRRLKARKTKARKAA